MIWKLHQMCTDVFNLPQMRHVPGFRISSTPMEIAVFCILGYWCSDLCSLAGPAPYTRWDKKCDIRTHTWTQSFEQPFICLDLIVNFFLKQYLFRWSAANLTLFSSIWLSDSNLLFVQQSIFISFLQYFEFEQLYTSPTTYVF